jgi:hypothetical protein
MPPLGIAAGFADTGAMTTGEIRIDEAKPGDFRLTVIHDGQEFACGSYVSRAAAAQAGRLFLERKRGEAEGRKKRPRGKR